MATQQHRYLATVRTTDDIGRVIRHLNALEINWEPEQSKEECDDTGPYYDFSFTSAELESEEESGLSKTSFVMFFYKDGEEYLEDV